MPATSVLPRKSQCFTVMDLGATDHMTLNKFAFISYKRVTNLQVQMGNNSYLLVLGRSTVIISLNG
jgi:hypothetical protein